MKNMQIFKKKQCLIIFSILITAFMIGTFYDYQISLQLYDSHNLFGIFFAGYGQLPAVLCASISGLFLIKLAGLYHSLKKYVCYGMGVLLQFISIVIITIDSTTNIKGMPMMLGIIIACFIILLTDIILYVSTKDAQEETLKKVIILMLVTVCLELLTITIVKEIWNRPRMRMITSVSEATFQPWWVIGNHMRENLMNIGIAAEEFRSFPSGHTGNAACAILLCILPLVCTKLKNKENILFWIGVGIAFTVALSRIVAGAHFLSDVTVGFTITFIIEMILIHMIIKE